MSCGRSLLDPPIRFHLRDWAKGVEGLAGPSRRDVGDLLHDLELWEGMGLTTAKEQGYAEHVEIDEDGNVVPKPVS